jgi:hypothetical protein
VDVGPFVIPGAQTTELIEPRESPLNDPSATAPSHCCSSCGTTARARQKRSSGLRSPHRHQGDCRAQEWSRSPDAFLSHNRRKQSPSSGTKRRGAGSATSPGLKQPNIDFRRGAVPHRARQLLCHTESVSVRHGKSRVGRARENSIFRMRRATNELGDDQPDLDAGTRIVDSGAGSRLLECLAQYNFQLAPPEGTRPP